MSHYTFLDQPRTRAARELITPAQYGSAVERYRRVVPIAETVAAAILAGALGVLGALVHWL